MDSYLLCTPVEVATISLYLTACLREFHPPSHQCCPMCSAISVTLLHWVFSCSLRYISSLGNKVSCSLRYKEYRQFIERGPLSYCLMSCIGCTLGYSLFLCSRLALNFFVVVMQFFSLVYHFFYTLYMVYLLFYFLPYVVYLLVCLQVASGVFSLFPGLDILFLFSFLCSFALLLFQFHLHFVFS